MAKASIVMDTEVLWGIVEAHYFVSSYEIEQRKRGIARGHEQAAGWRKAWFRLRRNAG